jgi:hypothetical protein
VTYRLAFAGGAVFLSLWAWMLTGFPKPDHLMPHGVMMVFGVLAGATLPEGAGRRGTASVALFMTLGFLSWFDGAFASAAVVLGAVGLARWLPAVALCLVASLWFPIAASLVALHLLAWRWRRRAFSLVALVVLVLAWWAPDSLQTVHIVGLGVVALLSTRWPAWLAFLPALLLRLGPPELWPLSAGVGAVAMLSAAAAGPPRPMRAPHSDPPP